MSFFASTLNTTLSSDSPSPCLSLFGSPGVQGWIFPCVGVARIWWDMGGSVGGLAADRLARMGDDGLMGLLCMERNEDMEDTLWRRWRTRR